LPRQVSNRSRVIVVVVILVLPLNVAPLAPLLAPISSTSTTIHPPPAVPHNVVVDDASVFAFVFVFATSRLFIFLTLQLAFHTKNENCKT